MRTESNNGSFGFLENKVQNLGKKCNIDVTNRVLRPEIL